MFRRRRKVLPPQEASSAFASFRLALSAVEQAREALVSAAPGGRTAGVPLAEALLRFESGLEIVGERMSAWNAEQVTVEWTACLAALDEAGRRAEALRLGDAPEGYEQLYGRLAELMEPLDAFGLAARRFSALGFR